MGNNNKEFVSVWDIIRDRRKFYYGSSKAVYRKCDLDKILKMMGDLHYIGELHTRCRLVPANQDFLHIKAIPHYNEQLKKMKEIYPNIREFQLMKPINNTK